MMKEINELLAQESALIGTEETVDMDFDIDDIQLTPAEESAILLDGIRSGCASDEEFEALVQESAIEMEAYGLIDDATTAFNAIGIATESNKTVKYKITKQTTLSREGKRAALLLAKQKAPQKYEKYIKAKKKFLEARQDIYDTFGSKGAALAKKKMVSGARTAAAMNSNAGRDIGAKINAGIKKADKDGKTGAAIRR